MRETVIIKNGSGDVEKTYLWQYRDAIRIGEIIAGQELIMELDRLLDGLSSSSYYYDTTRADEIIDFMENCIKLTKSPFYGKPMKLLMYQKAFVENMYSYKMSADDTDRFQRILLMIGRKNAKSETSSGIVTSEFLVGGEGKDIVCSSNDDNQADILYQACDTMRLMIDPRSKNTWRNQKGLKCLYNNNKVFKLSDRTRNKEGRNIDFAVIDEEHEMKDNVIIKSIEQSQSLKDNPKLIKITTEGFVDDGVLDEDLRRGRGVISGEISDVASERETYWLYTQDSEREIWEGNRVNRLWEKANPSLGVIKKYSYLEQQVEKAKTSKAERAFVFTKDFNIHQNSSQAWLLKEDFDYEADFDLSEFQGDICLGGVDIAETTDLACARILLQKPGDNRKYIKSKYFIPETKLEKSNDKSEGAKYEEWAKKGYLQICEGNYIDTTIIADWFYSLYENYGIRCYKCGYDVKFSDEFIKAVEQYGVECEMVYQRPEILHTPMGMVEADLKSRLIIGNNEMDKWNFGNTAQKYDSKGKAMPIKIAGKAGRKIDGAVATIILYEIYRRHRTEFTAAIGG